MTPAYSNIFKDSYPPVGEKETRFLNSGGIVAYAPEFYELLTQGEIKDADDDQLYYTKLFVDKNIRVIFKQKCSRFKFQF